MKFRNCGKDEQVRQNEKEGHFWIIVKTGETIDLPEDVGLRYGFKKVTESNQELPEVTGGKIGNTKVETKQFENKKYVSFWNELLKTKGIGLKTAKDIVKVFKTKEDLIKAISQDDGLPFRDDIEFKLRREYGQ